MNEIVGRNISIMPKRILESVIGFTSFTFVRYSSADICRVLSVTRIIASIAGVTGDVITIANHIIIFVNRLCTIIASLFGFIFMVSTYGRMMKYHTTNTS